MSLHGILRTRCGLNSALLSDAVMVQVGLIVAMLHWCGPSRLLLYVFLHAILVLTVWLD